MTTGVQMMFLGFFIIFSSLALGRLVSIDQSLAVLAEASHHITVELKP